LEHCLSLYPSFAFKAIQEQKRTAGKQKRNFLPSLFLPEKKDISGLSEGPATLIFIIALISGKIEV